MKDLAAPAKTVRVSIPASVAGNIDSLKKSFASVLGRLGCDACCSGYDIFLDIQRDVVLHKGFDQPTRFSSWATSTRDIPRVSVGLKPAAVNTMRGVESMLERLADMTGHSACATGCDMFFKMEEMFVIDQNFAIEEPIMRMG